jgi:hypothetical protein
MLAQNYSHVTKRLTRVQRRFEVWRRNRPRRTRTARSPARLLEIRGTARLSVNQPVAHHHAQ